MRNRNLSAVLWALIFLLSAVASRDASTCEDPVDDGAVRNVYVYVMTPGVYDLTSHP